MDDISLTEAEHLAWFDEIINHMDDGDDSSEDPQPQHTNIIQPQHLTLAGRPLPQNPYNTPQQALDFPQQHALPLQDQSFHNWTNDPERVQDFLDFHSEIVLNDPDLVFMDIDWLLNQYLHDSDWFRPYQQRVLYGVPIPPQLIAVGDRILLPPGQTLQTASRPDQEVEQSLPVTLASSHTPQDNELSPQTRGNVSSSVETPILFDLNSLQIPQGSMTQMSPSISSFTTMNNIRPQSSSSFLNVPSQPNNSSQVQNSSNIQSFLNPVPGSGRTNHYSRINTDSFDTPVTSSRPSRVQHNRPSLDPFSRAVPSNTSSNIYHHTYTLPTPPHPLGLALGHPSVNMSEHNDREASKAHRTHSRIGAAPANESTIDNEPTGGATTEDDETASDTALKEEEKKSVTKRKAADAVEDDNDQDGAPDTERSKRTRRRGASTDSIGRDADVLLDAARDAANALSSSSGSSSSSTAFTVGVDAVLTTVVQPATTTTAVPSSSLSTAAPAVFNPYLTSAPQFAPRNTFLAGSPLLQPNPFAAGPLPYYVAHGPSRDAAGTQLMTANPFTNAARTGSSTSPSAAASPQATATPALTSAAAVAIASSPAPAGSDGTAAAAAAAAMTTTALPTADPTTIDTTTTTASAPPSTGAQARANLRAAFIRDWPADLMLPYSIFGNRFSIRLQQRLEAERDELRAAAGLPPTASRRYRELRPPTFHPRYNGAIMDLVRAVREADPDGGPLLPADACNESESEEEDPKTKKKRKGKKGAKVAWGKLPPKRGDRGPPGAPRADGKPDKKRRR